MQVTKVTFNAIAARSFTNTDYYNYKRIDGQAEDAARTIAQNFLLIATLVNWLKQYPEEDPREQIAIIFGELPTVKKYTAKKRTYSNGYFTLWVED